jgi:hypothetical protein
VHLVVEEGAAARDNGEYGEQDQGAEATHLVKPTARVGRRHAVGYRPRILWPADATTAAWWRRSASGTFGPTLVKVPPLFIRRRHPGLTVSRERRRIWTS